MEIFGPWLFLLSGPTVMIVVAFCLPSIMQAVIVSSVCAWSFAAFFVQCSAGCYCACCLSPQCLH